ncbi:Helix-turn-helix domain-containing protein [Halogranum amylolyticum]|uniref:Helix-turn-helix domain-containing protein n=1 Tax=Halogranum amylolyticum TaxID=660520 RepID=A0A1H8VL95_9EURY|nr:winged helix-turn-helix domain-containing protein [Halogranum amylolyticum]SEP16191.1 Helix-turn-helix domain-containing protein [Halogranum amylolyticum]
MSEAESEEGSKITPEAAFAAIGNETRLRILHELWDAAEGPVPFTDLRKRVGMRDSSQFNYHLEQLIGPFVRKTEEGYRLRVAGAEIIWAVMMETYAAPVRLDPFEISGTCVVCGSSLRARYDDGMLFVECSACGQAHEGGLFSATGLLGRTNEEIVAAFHYQIRRVQTLSTKGVCWGCDGAVTPVVMNDQEDVPERVPDDYGTTLYQFGVKYECEHCTRWSSHAIGLVLLSHPTVIGFYDEHGIDLINTPYWEFAWSVSDERTTLVSQDPWLARVTIPLGDEELRATIDGELTITEIERVDVEATAEADETA